MIWVVGKGGVGKSTVATLLARHLAARGEDVLLVRLADRGLCAPLPAAPGVREIAVDGRSALDEYLAGVLPAALHGLVLRSELYRRFVAVAPGLEELLALGKIYDAARRGSERVVVDAPATGHGLATLRMPREVLQTFGESLVTREARRLDAELTARATTSVCVVTQPRALVVSETLELVEGLRALGLWPACLLINGCHDAPAGIATLLGAAPKASGLLAEALAAGRRRVALVTHEHAARRTLAAALPQLPALELPFAGAGRLDESAWLALDEVLDGALDGALGGALDELPARDTVP
ncbi:MAG: hypothetical protein KC503_07220 [Myxococcales bacterium]|nr:hypothetical protein [Myxococcales bacterium]